MNQEKKESSTSVADQVEQSVKEKSANAENFVRHALDSFEDFIFKLMAIRPKDYGQEISHLPEILHPLGISPPQEISHLLETSSQEKTRAKKKLKINDQIFSYSFTFAT
ncbi:MAG: hypothetical protein CM1200mP12_21300 [Gammaproteobacteria bacterium]|nr:MAG: hypothetical protein CM1200mP12_21300 [Gammaproteobacteria bacterium]